MYSMKLSENKELGGFNYEILCGPTIIGGGYRKEERDARSVGLEDLAIAQSFRVGQTEKTYEHK